MSWVALGWFGLVWELAFHVNAMLDVVRYNKCVDEEDGTS